MASEIQTDVPMLIGAAETEGGFFAPAELPTMDENTTRTRLRRPLGDDRDRIIALFGKTRPKATPGEICFTISGFGTNAMTEAQRQAELRRGAGAS